MSSQSKHTILVVSQEELHEKLQRDQLCPDVNEFFFFSRQKVLSFTTK